MARRALAYALAAGVAAFAVVGAFVTEIAVSAVEFSLFVGLPVGAIAGLTAFAFVALGLDADASPTRQRAALGLGAFGVVFLLVFAVEAVLLSTRLSIALPVATLVGAGFGAFAFVRSG